MGNKTAGKRRRVRQIILCHTEGGAREPTGTCCCFFSKLDFQSKVDVINTGRLTPELKGLLQTFSYLYVSVICTVCVCARVCCVENADETLINQ